MSIPIVAVVGRPNVGKSTLFNKLSGKRISIVEDTPGVTRDRVYSDCEWRGKKFTLVDTGGLEEISKGDEICSDVQEQSKLAIKSSDIIIFVCDVRSGITAADYDVASILQKSGKKVILCVNKIDNIGALPSDYYEFYNLGFGTPMPVSSVHGHGLGDLLDEVVDDFENISSDNEDGVIKVSIIGRPNTGKSSLLNKIAGEERSIVSDVMGTTRDCIDILVKKDGTSFLFIDTAGIRKKAKVNDNIEKYSVIRSYMAIDRSDVCLIVLDPETGFTEQDNKIAGYAHETGKASIFVVNKWDLIEKDSKTMREYENKLKVDFSFMTYTPFLFISALTGQRIHKLFPLIEKVKSESSKRISTGLLNKFLIEIISRVQPPSDRGKRLKIYYMTQFAVEPPTFILFVNNKDLLHFSYQRYIENQLRITFGFEGTPIKFIVREKSNK